MSECAWVALVEDTETYARSVQYFRYSSFATEEQAVLALGKKLYPAHYVIEATTNVYKYKQLKK